MASKLNDTKRTVLAGAASRTNLRVLPVPETLKVSEAMVDKMLRELLGAGLVTETPALESDVVWREVDGAGVTLIITDAGLAAIGIELGTAPVEPEAPRIEASKQNTIVALLRRRQGASIDEMTAATGWLPHSVRGWDWSWSRKRMAREHVAITWQPSARTPGPKTDGGRSAQCRSVAGCARGAGRRSSADPT